MKIEWALVVLTCLSSAVLAKSGFSSGCLAPADDLTNIKWVSDDHGTTVGCHGKPAPGMFYGAVDNIFDHVRMTDGQKEIALHQSGGPDHAFSTICGAAESLRIAWTKSDWEKVMPKECVDPAQFPNISVLRPPYGKEETTVIGQAQDNLGGAWQIRLRKKTYFKYDDGAGYRMAREKVQYVPELLPPNLVETEGPDGSLALTEPAQQAAQALQKRRAPNASGALGLLGQDPR